MATVRRMMQIYTEQAIAPEVLSIPILDDEVLIFLDPTKRTVVVELTAQSAGGVLAFGANQVVPIGVTDTAFTQVRLFQQNRDSQQYFYAPSHVASPELLGVLGAGLSVSQIGVTLTKPAGLVVGRTLAAHVYIDQSD